MFRLNQCLDHHLHRYLFLQIVYLLPVAVPACHSRSFPFPDEPLMVFPIRANLLEFAADHLDRLLGKSCIDRLVHKGSVTESSHTNGSD